VYQRSCQLLGADLSRLEMDDTDTKEGILLSYKSLYIESLLKSYPLQTGVSLMGS
jgi:hypothetical protein